jgi:hypothetical protein
MVFNVSHDLRTMPRQFDEFVQSSVSAGVLPVRQRLPVTKAVEQLILIWANERGGRMGEPGGPGSRLKWL